MKYGRLTQLEHVEGRKWRFRCDCGKIKVIRRSSVVAGRSRSCGCLWLERVRAANLKHGMDGTKVYSSWCQMRRRCNDPGYDDYALYGGRGIKVCDEWMASFKAFHQDMGDCPPNMTLDRLDSDKDYTKENCRWATMKQQQRNRRNNIWIEYNGQNKLLVDWCDLKNMNYKKVYYRLKVKKWPVAKAFASAMELEG